MVHALLAAAMLAVSVSAQRQQQPLAQDAADLHACTHPPYKVYIVSRSPLVMYLEDFLTRDERAHLLASGASSFTQSSVQGSGVSGHTRHAVRTSQSTSLDPDTIVRCIEQRALSLQGLDVPETHLEPMQLVKYAATQQYHFHTDWFTDDNAGAALSMGGNRATSIFGYVKVDNVTGGGTNFPLLEPVRDEKWCGFVDCDDELANGITFRPVEGNAVYWENLLPRGKDGLRRGDERTLHAGLPVVSGFKVGMNMWTREAPLPDHVRGKE